MNIKFFAIITRLVFATSLLFSTCIVWAAVPIVDLTDNSSNNNINDTGKTISQNNAGDNGMVDTLAPPASSSPSLPDTSSSSDTTAGADVLAARQSMPLDQRVKLLEQQLNNIVQMNLPAKIDSLQQQIQQLNGQLEQQNYTLQKLGVNTTTASSTHTTTLPESVAGTHKTDAESTLVDKLKASDNATNNTNPPAATNTIANAENSVVQNTSTAKTAATAATTSNNADGGGEDKAYQSALDLLSNKKNDAAINAFNAFLKNYPSSSYVPNAHYWLGELYSSANKNDLASKEFNTIIQKYPTNGKVPDAMLKLAIMHDDAGQHAQAKRELQKIVQDYPTTGAARLAKLRLQQTP